MSDFKPGWYVVRKTGDGTSHCMYFRSKDYYTAQCRVTADGKQYLDWQDPKGTNGTGKAGRWLPQYEAMDKAPPGDWWDNEANQSKSKASEGTTRRKPPVDPNARVVTARYDKRGDPRWESQTSSPDDTFALCYMVPDRIIPVIFVPGVMGSNLKGTGSAAGTKWRLDGATSMLPWLGKGAADRKATLTPATMEVDDEGALPDGTLQTKDELKARGWGEVGAMSYTSFLVWLENALGDFHDPHDGERVKLMKEQLHAMVGEATLTEDEVALSYRYRFPVFACGYNWLDSNARSAKELGKRIDKIIARYRAENKKCEKVIIVTHSMGGLVARHCSEVVGLKEKIFGVVHGVMPAIGAAAVYRRFKAGTEDMSEWWNLAGFISAKVLGNNAADMTAVLSSAPGPMQLLPTPEYGNHWLKIKDGENEYTFPKNGDPYGEIYVVRGKWWSMCEDGLINPLNKESDAEKRKEQTDLDWAAFAKLIYTDVEPFHEQIKKQYNATSFSFIGSHKDNLAYGTVTWKGNGGSWLRGKRDANVLDARPVLPDEIGVIRTVAAELDGEGWLKAENQRYRISDPDENGDGTVPNRSGIAVKSASQAFLEVNVGHEPAYKYGDGPEHQRACRFTLRSIVKIAQAVQKTSLKYE
jgi:PGAP1-like protein